MRAEDMQGGRRLQGRERTGRGHGKEGRELTSLPAYRSLSIYSDSTLQLTRSHVHLFLHAQVHTSTICAVAYIQIHPTILVYV